jgi:hypothetical protein
MSETSKILNQAKEMSFRLSVLSKRANDLTAQIDAGVSQATSALLFFLENNEKDYETVADSILKQVIEPVLKQHSVMVKILDGVKNYEQDIFDNTIDK